jgi:hypothetical protein
VEVSDQAHVHAALPPRYASNSRLGGEKNRMSDRPAIKLVILSTAISCLHEENSAKLTGGRLNCGAGAYSYIK